MIEVQRSIARMRLRHLPDLAGNARPRMRRSPNALEARDTPLARMAPAASPITPSTSNPFNTISY